MGRLSNDEKKENQSDDLSHNLQLETETSNELPNTENITFNEDDGDSDDNECEINLDVLSPLALDVLALYLGAGVGDDDDDPDSQLAKISWDHC